MSGAVETIQANLREEVLNSTMNIQHYTSEKNNRSIEETASLQNILNLQGQTRERLETIHEIVSGLATTGQQAEEEQKQRLAHLRTPRRKRSTISLRTICKLANRPWLSLYWNKLYPFLTMKPFAQIWPSLIFRWAV